MSLVHTAIFGYEKPGPLRCEEGYLFFGEVARELLLNPYLRPSIALMVTESSQVSLNTLGSALYYFKSLQLQLELLQNYV